MLPNHEFRVTVKAATAHEAERVMAERINHDEQIEGVGDYQIECQRLGSPLVPAQGESVFPITSDIIPRAEWERRIAEKDNRIVQLTQANERLQQQLSDSKAEMRRQIIEALETPLEVDDLNRVLESLDMDPVLTAVEVDLTITMRAVLDITSNEITTLADAKKALTERDFSTDERGGIRMSHMSSGFEVRDTEDVEVTVKRVDQRF